MEKNRTRRDGEPTFSEFIAKKRPDSLLVIGCYCSEVYILIRHADGTEDYWTQHDRDIVLMMDAFEELPVLKH